MKLDESNVNFLNQLPSNCNEGYAKRLRIFHAAGFKIFSLFKIKGNRKFPATFYLTSTMNHSSVFIIISKVF